MYHFYMAAWWSYIILLDAALSLKTRRYLVLNRHLPYLIILSAAFWCLFELINVRLENWFYAAIPSNPIVRFTGYLLAYGTVIPAIYLTNEVLLRLLPEISVRPMRLGNFPAYSIPLGFLLLVLSLLLPTYFFAVAWIFLAFILEGCNYRRGYPSFLGQLEKGSLKGLVAAALSGIVCGFLWEIWNYWSVTKWIYTVPFFEDLKVFEMPVLGYLGFAFFALETIAFLNLFKSSPDLTAHRWATSMAALAFCLLSFFFIDRFTVFSYAAGVGQLSFLPEEKREDLLKRGVKGSYGIDPAVLTDEESRKLTLVHLKGLGLRNFNRLKKRGIETVSDLATLNEEQLSSIIEEKNKRRVRVYLKAAQKHENRLPNRLPLLPY